MIVSFYPQHISFPRPSGREICGTVIVLPAWSRCLPSLSATPQREGQGQGPGRCLGPRAGQRCGWCSVFSLLSAHADPLLPVSPPSSPICQRKKEDGPPGGGAGCRAGPGKHTADVAKATVFCFYCTSWLRCPALSTGPQHKMLLKFKQRNCVSLPGSQRGGELLCGFF